MKKEKGPFLSNTFDPKLPNARMYFTHTFHARDCGPAAMDKEYQRHLDWINSNEIGRPEATEKYTTEQLETNGLIGIYSKS